MGTVRYNTLKPLHWGLFSRSSLKPIKLQTGKKTGQNRTKYKTFYKYILLNLKYRVP